MSKKYFLSIDQGTSGTKALIFDNEGQLVHRCDAEHRQYYPRPGWVEHDPVEIYEKTVEAIKRVFSETGITDRDLYCLSISNQRETAVVWDRFTGEPVCPAIVWQCQRAETICRKISERGYAGPVREKTGLVLSPYFSAAKVGWILENIPQAGEKAKRGSLLFGTVDSWLIWKLTGGKAHKTDYSNASRTQMYNIYDLKWDREILELFGIPESMLPEVCSSDQIFGYTETVFSRPVPIAGVMGDSHAALFGQCCFRQGMAKATFGTGSSVMLNIGSRPVKTRGGVVTSIGFARGGSISYVLEGNINCTGATIKWLIDDLELVSGVKESNAVAASVSDTLGVYFVPAFVGLSAPYWDSEARAEIVNISRGVKKAHIVRAAEESIAYQIKDVIENMNGEVEFQLLELRVDGGPTRDEFVMQFLSDILDVPVIRSTTEELSGTGAMYMGGMALGVWSTYDEIESMRKADKKFESLMNKADRENRYKGWLKAVKKALTK